VARDRAHQASSGPRVAGIELAAGMVRAVVARAEGGRLRVVGRGEIGLAVDAIAGGLVVEPGAVTAAVGAALAAAERGVPADRTVIAVDGDDVRTYHVTTPFDREESGTAIVRAEADRAVREAREEAARVAQTAVADDPALRGMATARLTDEVAALVLDGRELDSIEGYHGRALEVHTDVAVAPLVLSGAALATVAPRRRPTAVPGIYALARLVAASGIADAGVVRVGADVTALASSAWGAMPSRPARTRATTTRACGLRSSRSRSAPTTRLRRSGGCSSACLRRSSRCRMRSRRSSARRVAGLRASGRSRQA